MKSFNKKQIDISDIIPPRSVVELVRADDETPCWKDSIGKHYRIGYYSRQDGLDVIWLVDDTGDYCETTDRDYLLKYFRIIRLSKCKDYFGVGCKRLGPIRGKRPKPERDIERAIRDIERKIEMQKKKK